MIARPGRDALRILAVVPVSALVWWLVGFLPWILEGRPGAVPLVGSALGQLVLGGVLGGLAATLVGTLVGGVRPASVGASSAGLVLGASVALRQSASTIEGSSMLAVDDRVLTGLVLVTAGATVVGWLLGALVLLGPVGLGLALAPAAGAVPP